MEGGRSPVVVGVFVGVVAGVLAGCDGGFSGAGSEAGFLAPQWPLEQELRIGSIDDPEQALTRIYQVLIGPDERLYVLQRRERMIRVFDREGGLVTTIGRQGEGPGEFGSLESMAFLGDSLQTSDRSVGRVSFFSADGVFLSSIPWATRRVSGLSGQGSLQMSAPQFVLPDGRGLILPGSLRGVPVPEAEEATIEHRDRTLVARTSADQEAFDTITFLPTLTRTHVLPVGGQAFSFGCPWTDSPFLTLMGDGSGAVVIERPAGTEAIGFTVIDPAGDTLVSRAIPYAPRPLTQPEVAATIESIREPAITAGQPAPSAATIEAKLREYDCIPAAYPPVTGYQAMQDGSVWLKREAVPSDSIQWTVVDRTGAPEGTVMLPVGQVPEAFSDDLLVVAETDEFDVPYLVRYRVQR